MSLLQRTVRTLLPHLSRSLTVSNKLNTKKVKLTFIDRDGHHKNLTAITGASLYDVIVDNNIEFDGFGACEGSLSCSTCHLILDKELFTRIDEALDEELDMLDLATELTETSRLGCQVYVDETMDGSVIRLPRTVTDRRDG
ncbi:hypothetical protein SNEBB_007622 [Seison nebaliae]|nr:hypothetical protein SNEBB_007622 [Seison nebaliae]